MFLRCSALSQFCQTNRLIIHTPLTDSWAMATKVIIVVGFTMLITVSSSLQQLCPSAFQTRIFPLSVHTDPWWQRTQSFRGQVTTVRLERDAVTCPSYLGNGSRCRRTTGPLPAVRRCVVVFTLFSNNRSATAQRCWFSLSMFTHGFGKALRPSGGTAC